MKILRLVILFSLMGCGPGFKAHLYENSSTSSSSILPPGFDFSLASIDDGTFCNTYPNICVNNCTVRIGSNSTTISKVSLFACQTYYEQQSVLRCTQTPNDGPVASTLSFPNYGLCGSNLSAPNCMIITNQSLFCRGGVVVEPNTYDASVSVPTVQVNGPGDYTVSVIVTNTGAVAWNNSGVNPVVAEGSYNNSTSPSRITLPAVALLQTLNLNIPIKSSTARSFQFQLRSLDTNYTFAKFSIDLPQTQPTGTNYSLSITSVGGGQVSFNNQICRGSTCSQSFAGGTGVNATATADSGYLFSGWNNAACGGISPTPRIVVVSDLNCVATFTRMAATPTIQVNVPPGGQVNSALGNCRNSSCTFVVTAGSIALQAVADTNFVFDGWNSAACGGNNPNPNVAVSQDIVCIANFAQRAPTSFTYQVTVPANGYVRLPDGSQCRDRICSLSFAANSQQDFAVTADSGYQFSGWNSGQCGGSNSSFTLLIDRNFVCSVSFAAVSPVNENCAVATSLGSTNIAIPIGNTSACQNAFNTYWTQLCSTPGNTNTTFTYNLSMPSRGTVGSGTNYCVNGAPSSTAPILTTSCQITTSLGNRTTNVPALSSISYCQNDFNVFWGSLCTTNPNTSFTYSIDLQGVGRIGSGTNYCINGQPSSTSPVAPTTENCAIATDLGSTNVSVPIGNTSACQNAYNTYWTQICGQSSNANTTFTFNLSMPSRGTVGSGTHYCVNGAPSSTAPILTTSCQITTSLGNRTTNVPALSSISYCQNDFNVFWGTLCGANANTSFTYSINLAGVGSVGSGTNYCINGQPSSTPPAPTSENCAISTDLGSTNVSVPIGNTSACQNAFNIYWAQLCSEAGNADTTFTFYLSLPSRGAVGSGTNYCVNGQPSTTGPILTSTCQINTSLGSVTRTVPRTAGTSACQNEYNTYWTSLCNQNANTSFSFTLDLSGVGRVGSGTNYCINGSPSATPPVVTTENCGIYTSAGSTNTTVNIGDVSACQNNYNTFWAQLCNQSGNSDISFTFNLNMPSRGSVGSGTHYCVGGSPSATAPILTLSCQITTSLGSKTTTVPVVGSVSECQNDFNIYWGELCGQPGNEDTDLSYSLRVGNTNAGSGTVYCVNGQATSTPPVTVENCAVTTSLGNLNRSVTTGDTAACQTVFNNHWIDICNSNPFASFTFSLNLPSNGQIGSGTNHCVNGQPSSVAPEYCSIYTDLGSTDLLVAPGDVSACQNAFNNHWTNICSDPNNAGAAFAYSLYLPSRGNVGSGTANCN